jgi:uncharacterized lipoprotein NlpE involved in copper resistance
MKKNIIILIIVLSFMGCNKKQESIKTTLKPTNIKIINDKCNLGVLRPDTTVKGYFVVKNIGEEVLIYQDIIADCGCTTIKKKKDSVQKGEIDTIFFELNTRGMKKNTIVQKTVRIITNTIPDLNRFLVLGEIE